MYVAQACFVLMASALSVDSILLEDYGDIDYNCVADFDYEISGLSNDDLDRVEELSFVYILYRHGNRFDSTPFSEFFENIEEPEIICNIKRVKSLTGVDPEASPSDYLLRFVYPDQNGVFRTNSNCESTQLSDNAEEQLIKTGEIVAERYFSKRGRRSDQFKRKDRSAELVLSRVNRVNRVLDSQVYFLEGFLGSVKKGKSTVVDTLVYEDRLFDPFEVVRGQSFCSTSSAEFSQWNDIYEDTAQNTAAKEELVSTAEAQEILAQFASEGGVYDSLRDFLDIGFYYCNNIDIPLTEDTFEAFFELARQEDKTWDESEAGASANRCFAHQVMRSAYDEVKTQLENVLREENNKKIFVQSSQQTILRLFLWGLDMNGVPGDRKGMKQAEVVTFEVYKKKGVDKDAEYDVNDYLFRWTRDGEFMEYPPCENQYEDNDSELCELETLMSEEYGFVDAVPLDELNNECQTFVSDCVCGFCPTE